MHFSQSSPTNKKAPYTFRHVFVCHREWKPDEWEVRQHRRLHPIRRAVLKVFERDSAVLKADFSADVDRFVGQVPRKVWSSQAQFLRWLSSETGQAALRRAVVGTQGL